MSWIFAAIGVCATFWVGHHILGFTPLDSTYALVATNVGGLFGLLLTLRLETISWVKLRILRGALPTWSLLLGSTIGVAMLLFPKLREPVTLAWLFFPLFFSVAIMFPLFGVIQDTFVRTDQRRARMKLSAQTDRTLFS